MASKNGSVQCKSTSSECDIGKELVKAAHEGKVDLVASLLEQGADVNNSKNERGYTPLVAGCLGGSTEVVKLLIELGADVNMRANIEDEEVSGFVTPLYVAIMGGHEEVAALLIEHGADVNTLGMGGKEGEVTGSFTHLMAAVMYGLQRSTKLLLKHGAEVEKEVELTIEGKTKSLTALIAALLLAANVDVAKLLLEYGAQVNLQASKGGHTALMGASEAGRCEVARVLLEHDAEVDLQDSEGRSALMYAVYGADKYKDRNIGIVQLLIQHGAKIDLQNAQGQTALDVARKKGLTDIVELLTNPTTAQAIEVHTASVTCEITPTESHNLKSVFTNMFQIFHRKLDTMSDKMDTMDAKLSSRLDTLESKVTTLTCTVQQVEQQVQGGFQTQSETATTLTASLANLSASNNPSRQQDSERPKVDEALQILCRAAHEWKNIGVSLRLDPGILTNIEHTYARPVDRLREMLTEWLNRMNPPPTWQALADAVREFNEERAHQIENVHIRK